MAKKQDTTDQIISKLREAEVELTRGLKVPQVCKKLEVAEQIYPARENMLTCNRSTANYATSCLTGSCSLARPKLATCSMRAAHRGVEAHDINGNIRPSVFIEVPPRRTIRSERRIAAGSGTGLSSERPCGSTGHRAPSSRRRTAGPRPLGPVSWPVPDSPHRSR